MELVVLGASAAYPGPGKACSGYLLREGNTNILIDCGPGVLSNLLRWIDPASLNSLIITHLHTDHFLDIYPLRYYLQYEKRVATPLLVITPSGGKEHFLRLIAKERQDLFMEVFQFRHFVAMEEIKIGTLHIRPFLVPHFKETYALNIEGKKRVVFSSDCGFECKPIISEAAGDVDLLVCEATLQAKDDLLEKGHLTAEQAGKIAAEAGAKRLLLTHIWSSLDPRVSKKQAENYFPGEVIIAEENRKYLI